MDGVVRGMNKGVQRGGVEEEMKAWREIGGTEMDSVL